MKEIWKDVKEYEGLYQVSNLGKVKSLQRNGTIKQDRILKQYIDKYGYYYVGLRNKKIKKFKVHRLVAEAFIPNKDNLVQINHKDENKKNNNVKNLEWCSAKYNVNYGTRTERTFKKVACICIGEKTKEEVYKSIKEASIKLNIDSSAITKCCKGKQKTAGGYIWKYVALSNKTKEEFIQRYGQNYL